MALNLDEICQLALTKRLAKDKEAVSCVEPHLDACAPAHNEFICHTMGEKRHHYLKEVKRLLDKLDSADCPTNETIQETYGTGAGDDKHGSYRGMMKYPGYIDMESSKYREAFYVPLISSIPVKEIRPTSDIYKYKDEKSPILEYRAIDKTPQCHPWSLQRQKSYELRGGIMYKGCNCSKHNGLQDRCERTECDGMADCKTKPSPTCGPSLSHVCPPSQRPIEDMVREVVTSRQGETNKTYCCCPISKPPVHKMFGGRRYPDCDHAEGPGKFECYRCRQ